ncbi:MAG: hypothetical protein Kow0029_05220 [Candidatus Rifleibacteriota bacterium]
MTNIFKHAFVFSLIFVLLIAHSSFSATPVIYETTRALAMGGTCVAIADDQQALFCNPAGLGMQTKSSYSIFDPFFERNRDFDKVDSHIAALSNSDTAGSRNSNYDNLIKIIGKHGWQAFSNLAYYLGGTGFGMGVYYRESESYSVKNPVNPVVKSRVEKDALVSGSIARSFFENQHLFNDRAIGWWGATMKFASRRAADKSFYARDFSLLNEKVLKDTDRSGATMDFDLGAIWQLNNSWQPTIGVFAGNILSSEFSADIGTLKRQFAFGASFRPLTGPPERNEKLLLAVDYWETGDDRSALTKLRMGAEFKLSRHFFLQTGIRSGYFSVGASIKWNDWRFQAATYSEELGQNPGDNEDRRYALSAAWQF